MPWEWPQNAQTGTKGELSLLLLLEPLVPLVALFFFSLVDYYLSENEINSESSIKLSNDQLRVFRDQKMNSQPQPFRVFSVFRGSN